MGVTNVPTFPGGSGDKSAFLDHIDCVAKSFGTDVVTIGMDTAYDSRAPRNPAVTAKLRPFNFGVRITFGPKARMFSSQGGTSRRNSKLGVDKLAVDYRGPGAEGISRTRISVSHSEVRS